MGKESVFCRASSSVTLLGCPRWEQLPAPLPCFSLYMCVQLLSWLRWGCFHLVSRLEWLVAESKSEHKNKVFLEICFCCIFSKLLLNTQFGPGSS